MQHPLRTEPLTSEGFAPFGTVVSLDHEPAPDLAANRRLPDSSGLLDFQGGNPILDVLYSAARPMEVAWLERHVNSSQTFLPLSGVPFVVVVAGAGAEPGDLRAFVSDGRQGITLAPGVLHHPLFPVGRSLAFFMLHRSPDGDMETQIVQLSRQVQVSA